MHEFETDSVFLLFWEHLVASFGLSIYGNFSRYIPKLGDPLEIVGVGHRCSSAPPDAAAGGADDCGISLLRVFSNWGCLHC